MSAQPTHAPVSYLEPVPSISEHAAPDARDEALTELALALDTQRSANKAMLEAVKGLDQVVVQHRKRAEELERQNQGLEAQLVEYAAAVTQQVAENKRLWCEVRLAEHRLEEELDKPTWRRLLRR